MSVLAFLTINNNEVIDSESITINSSKLIGIINSAINNSGAVRTFNASEHLPAGSYDVRNILNADVTSVVNKMNESAEGISIDEIRTLYDVMDIIEDKYWSDLVIY